MNMNEAIQKLVEGAQIAYPYLPPVITWKDGFFEVDLDYATDYLEEIKEK